jgi:hypothetical protein
MTGTPLLVLAIALFVASLVLERILEHLAAKRKQSAMQRPTTVAPANTIFSSRTYGDIGAPQQSTSFSADTPDQGFSSSGERDSLHFE